MNYTKLNSYEGKYSMQDSIQKLLQNLKKTNHPGIKANEFTRFVSNALKNNQITLYEAYLLNGEVINYTRDNYLQAAWKGPVR